MYEESERSYFKGGLAVGISLGLLSGVASTILYHRKKALTADQVLAQIKESFLEEGAIEGSWISFEKEPIRKFAVRSNAYRGGISRVEDGEIVYYEFLADARTGTVLDITRKKGESAESI
ncbi:MULTISPECIES: PepSY domain-containing protein [unclassified Enterococcus]|uniref:PepSY domain-containing protein n=1 Tax=unclassified Enterococcus TaxID=2608891 RepID=UPI0013ED3570|nr:MULTISPECIES: PepSY domain-containing protein [unclassified Enterococcus]